MTLTPQVCFGKTALSVLYETVNGYAKNLETQLFSTAVGQGKHQTNPKDMMGMKAEQTTRRAIAAAL